MITQQLLPINQKHNCAFCIIYLQLVFTIRTCNFISTGRNYVDSPNKLLPLPSLWRLSKSSSKRVESGITYIIDSSWVSYIKCNYRCQINSNSYRLHFEIPKTKDERVLYDELVSVARAHFWTSKDNSTALQVQIINGGVGAITIIETYPPSSDFSFYISIINKVQYRKKKQCWAIISKTCSKIRF